MIIEAYAFLQIGFNLDLPNELKIESELMINLSYPD